MGDRAGRPIREELLSIPGIAGAEFDGDPRTPAGVRVQLAPGADAEAVGREVRRVLAGHGMRSQMTAPAVAPRNPPPPPGPDTVVKLADFDQGSAGGKGRGESEDLEEPDDPDAVEEPGGLSPEETPAAASGVSEHEAVEVPDVPSLGSVPTLHEVSVKQRGAHVLVAIAAGGRIVERLAVASAEGIDRALLDVICELLDVAPVPELVSIDETDRHGTAIVSVLLDDGSSRRAGSAVIRGDRAWGVARALWAALSGPA